MSYHLLISDIHLDVDRPQHLEALKVLLKQHAGQAERLYVLGDLFDSWAGDDNVTDFNTTTIKAFSDFSDSGSELYFMHGNRDFALGERFCHETGGTMLQEGDVADFHGTAVMLMHGDSLCTKDEKYQAFRAQSRDPAWQKQMMARPLEERRMFAQMLRQKSKMNKSNLASNIMDVTQEEVVRVMEEAGVEQMIHGHTHRPAVHDVALSSGKGRRWVLGDWGELGWQIVADADKGIRLQSFSINELINAEH